MVCSGQHLIAAGRACNGQRSTRRIIHVGNGAGGSAGYQLCRSTAIRVPGGYGDRFTHRSLIQHQLICGGTNNTCTIGLPLVTDDTQSVDVRKGVRCCQRLFLRWGSGDSDRSGGQVVQIEHRSGGRTRDRLGRPAGVGVACAERDGFTHQCFGQQQRGWRCAADGSTIGSPLVTNTSQSIHIGNGVYNGKSRVLNNCADQGQGSCGRVIDIGYQGGG